MFIRLLLFLFFFLPLYGETLPEKWDSFRRKDCELKPVARRETVPGEYFVTIIGVIDGDSLCGEDKGGFQYHIRLDGIDAPEYRQSQYLDSKRALAEAVLQKEVCLGVKEYDRYKRIIGRVFGVISGECDKTASVNLRMVQEGWAWVYRYFFKEDEFFSLDDFVAAEESARETRSGIWKDPDPQNPYDCRRTRKCR